MVNKSNDFTTSSEVLDQLVNAAARGTRVALEALEVRYGIVIIAAVRARVFKEQHRFIDGTVAWAAAAKALRRIPGWGCTGEAQPFLAWLGYAADEAVTMQVPDQERRDDDDALDDADRCAFELHVIGYGSAQIGEVLAEPAAAIEHRIENAKEILLARAMASNAE
jgi:hypothetical protein